MLMERRSLSYFALRIVFFTFLMVTIVVALFPELRLPEPKLTRGMTDLIYHVLGFAGLSYIGGMAWRSVYGLVIGLTFGAIALELAQHFSPGRGVHLHDILANLSGVACGISLFMMTNQIRRFWFRHDQ